MITVPPLTIYGLHLDGEKIRYVGLTTRTMEDRMYGHEKDAENNVRRPVCLWIAKHGIKNIRHQILEECPTLDDLREAEKRWIATLETYVYANAGGLNATLGGDGVPGHRYTDEECLERSERQTKKWEDPEYRAHMSIKLAVPRGPYSDERKKPWIEAGRAARVGCKRSPEYIAKHKIAVAAGRARNLWVKEMAYLDVPAEDC